VPSRRITSTYADPLAWLVLYAAERAIDSAGNDPIRAREAVGHLFVSDFCTIHTMQDIAAASPGRHVSPLRFSGANPGVAGTLPCQLLGLSGPSMTLSMSPGTGLPTAVVIARAWLGQRTAEYIIITVHEVTAAGNHAVSSSVLGLRDHQSLL
jgi:3-oxoacyl-(acyl-carrier-protein) synthase